MKRQFVATAYILNDDNRVLLLWHKKLNCWLTPGGHIDPDELPEDAAVRETKEETGFDVEIIGDHCDIDFPDADDGERVLKKPFAMLLENIPLHEKTNEPAHQHMDFAFEAKLTDKHQESELNMNESNEMRWFSEDDLLKLTSEEIFENVRAASLHLIRKRKNR